MERAGGSAILLELRRELKRQDMRIEHLSDKLGVAAPTVWRWLRGKGLTLDNLDRICGILNIDIRELITRSEHDGPDYFTLAQERVLAADRGLGLMFYALLNGVQKQDCEQEFGLTADQVDHYLNALRRLGLLDIGPNGRIRTLTSRAVKTRRGGPLAKAFNRTVKEFFLSMDLGAQDADYVSDMVRLSEAGRARVHALFEALRSDIHVITEQERAARLERYDWCGLLMLVRPLDIGEVTRDLG